MKGGSRKQWAKKLTVTLHGKKYWGFGSEPVEDRSNTGARTPRRPDGNQAPPPVSGGTKSRETGGFKQNTRCYVAVLAPAAFLAAILYYSDYAADTKWLIFASATLMAFAAASIQKNIRDVAVFTGLQTMTPPKP